MKKLTLIILIILIAILAFYTIGAYNEILSKDERSYEAFSQVQNQYKRRADLVPALVKTVSAYAKYEKQTFTQVVQARANATSVHIDNLNDTKQMQQFINAQQNLSGALSRLLVTVERYPELKANQNFLSLQAQLEGTENRIAVARKDYIASIKEYNLILRKIPTSFIARVFLPELKPRSIFQASKQEQTMPEINFEN